LLLHIRVGREILKRKNVVCGKAYDTIGIHRTGQLASCTKRRFQSFGCFVIRDDDEHRLLRRSRQQRKVQRTRCIGESGQTSPPDTEGEVPANAIKRGGLLQFRENFADKREDHAESSLSARRVLRIAQRYTSSEPVSAPREA